MEIIKNETEETKQGTTGEDQAKEKETSPAKFAPPTKAEDFAPGVDKIEHTYDNGNKVVWVLLSNGKVARIREGKGNDVEQATMESEGNKAGYLTALTASCVTIEGRNVNMFELKEEKMKDYLKIQSEFATLNF